MAFTLLSPTMRNQSDHSTIARIEDGLAYSPTDLLQLQNSFLVQVRKEFKALAVSLWSHDPVGRRLIYSASHGLSITEMGSLVLDARAAHSGAVIETKRPLTILLATPSQGGRVDQHPRQSSALGAQWMASIPVLNLSNANQVIYVINLLFASQPRDFDNYISLGRLFAEHYESALHERCFRESNLLHLDLARTAVGGTMIDVCRTLAARVSRFIRADAVGIYLRGSQDDLRLAGVSISGIRTLMQFHAHSVALADEVMTSNRERLEVNISVPHSDPGVRSPSSSASIGAVPIRNLAGQAAGAIVCVRLFQPSLARHCTFTYDDLTGIEALGQAFTPYHELLYAEQERLEALSRLGHELKGPILGLRAALERTRHELHGRRFEHDYINDLDGYTELISKLSDEFELGTENLDTKLHREKLNLVHDLFAPSMRAVVSTLSSRGYTEGRISRPGLHMAPAMWLDRSRMLQVIFNLLENAIKYSDPDPTQFSIDVTFSVQRDNYEISFRDQGMGIPAGYEQRIFILGTRAPNASQRHATGKGFGLSIARNIVRAHGGELEYRRHEQGSEFVITLPKRAVQVPRNT